MKEISVQELRNIFEQGKQPNTAVIDVRTSAEYHSTHIPEAVSIPLNEVEKHIDELRKYDIVYAYCQSGNRSGQACERLNMLGLENLVNVRGGISEWERVGFVVEHNRVGYHMPLLQQLLLTAGTLILSGFVLAWFVHPYFLGMPLVVGIGFTFAGITGKCFMMFMLSKMPWNR